MENTNLRPSNSSPSHWPNMCQPKSHFPHSDIFSQIFFHRPRFAEFLHIRVNGIIIVRFKCGPPWIWPALGLATGASACSTSSALFLHLLLHLLHHHEHHGVHHSVHATHHAWESEMRKDERMQKKMVQGEYCLITTFLWYSKEYHRKSGKASLGHSGVRCLQGGTPQL